MPAPALRLEEPTFREGIAKYVTTKCRSLQVPHDDVDDLVQEALIHILVKVGTFRPEKSEFEQWARGIAWNVIREYRRKSKLHFAHFTGYHPSVYDYAAQDPSPERCARQNQARCAIEDAAEGISSQQAQVLVLHAVENMSHGEIGRELCISEAMSQKDYQRARNHLARCFSGKAFSVMPPSLAGCNDLSFNENHSRWPERSHYAGQIVASIVALLTLVPSCFEPQMHESKSSETRVLGTVQNAVMYSSDQRVDVHDEPAVHRDAPSVKPEPASLPSVRDVSTHAKVVDKPAYVQDLAPLPPYNHSQRTPDHHLRGR